MNTEAVAISGAGGGGSYEEKGADSGRDGGSPYPQGAATSPTLAAGGGMAQSRQIDAEEDDGEIEEEKPDQPLTRQDLFVCFTNDKDLRHHETISIKASLYKGIAVRVKILNHIWIENLLFAIESAKDLGIVNLRFEDCRLLKKAVMRLIDFCKSTNIIESLGLIKVTFDDGQDFKRLVEAVSFNHKIRHFAVQSAEFDEDYHGKTMARCILESRSLKELDLSHVTFEDPKSFYEMANGLLNERCRLAALKLRGIQFGQLEGKVMQFILMRNKSLQTLDLSQCSTDSPENLENVFCKFDQFCNVRTLVAENLNADFNYIIEIFGEALGVNTKLEGLSLKENKLKQTQYCNFWQLMAENRSLRKINVAKTEVTDKVCTHISIFLQQPDLRLHDLNLSRNQIAAEGLIALADALQVNNSLRTLNLASNFIREGGLQAFVEALKKNSALQELCLSFNKINNAGISALSGFLADNNTLKVLDISRNAFSDSGFVDFARELAHNKGIESLNLSKNKDVTDEVGLKQLAHALATNSSLAVIDLSGLKVRKPCVIQYFQPALKSNITLKKIVGKIPPGIINEDLKDNVTIESDITSRYKTVKKESRRELSKLPLHRTEGDQTQLNLENMGNELLTPALKLIRYRRIHAVNLNNMQLEDESLRLLALYLEENPALRSLAIAQNHFTDDGLAQLIHALRSNTHLNHLNILGCASITDQSLRALEDMVTEVNMSLYAVELNAEDFDPDLVASILAQAAMNRAIQEHLKPRRVVTGGLVEIQFTGKSGSTGVRIAEHFDSAIKAWRILGTSFIRAVNEGLGDEHVEKLCAFLSGRNLIQSLNLRRNKIGNRGAIAIADYVRKADRTLTSLELERNEIQDEGGEALLKAMQANMRMECCKMTYGNPLRPKICRQIETEIKANLQIKATVVPAYKANGYSLVHYEESDRGPDFVRCALKSCELFKILHLSLPDNMIGEKEMVDIAYVLSRNTPLRTLNLSDNVVDAKASLVLAQSLGSNSHLRELDLRNNRLGNAGVAVLMEPFIRQKLRIAEDEGHIGVKKTAKGGKGLVDTDADEPVQKGQKKSKKNPSRKLKMKIERLFLDNNQQTHEALKHIYTALTANKDIEISIDLPASAVRDSDESAESDVADEAVESQELLSPTVNAVVPHGEPRPLGSGRGEQVEDVDTAAPRKAAPLAVHPEQGDDDEAEGHDSDKEAGAGEGKRHSRAPTCCRARACRTCRELCCRDPTKRKKSCTRIVCADFLTARSQVLRFKTSWQLFVDVEKLTQHQVFMTLLASMLLYFALAIVLPFVIGFTGPTTCGLTPTEFWIIHGAYCGFVVLSTVAEGGILIALRKALKTETGAGPLACNRYLYAKWWQGQLASLDTFVHIGFVATGIRCLLVQFGPDEHDAGSRSRLLDEAAGKAVEVLADSNPKADLATTTASAGAALAAEAEAVVAVMEHYVVEHYATAGAALTAASSVLAVVAAFILILSHWRRVRYIWEFLPAKPEVHRLLPNAHRNTQLAWLCNFQATAVVLESISLSDYMTEYGGPVIAGKQKDRPVGPTPVVKDITGTLLVQKLKYQDLPMLLILVVHFLAAMGEPADRWTVPLVQVGVTLLSILSGYTSYRWQRAEKGVDMKTIVKIIQERAQEIAQRREDKEAGLLEGSKDQKEARTGKGRRKSRAGQSAGEDSSGGDTGRSDADSNGLNDVMHELELLKQGAAPTLPRAAEGRRGSAQSGRGGEAGDGGSPRSAGDPGATLTPPDEHEGRTPAGTKLDLVATNSGFAGALGLKRSGPTSDQSPTGTIEASALAAPGGALIDLDSSITKQDVRA